MFLFIPTIILRSLLLINSIFQLFLSAGLGCLLSAWHCAPDQETELQPCALRREARVGRGLVGPSPGHWPRDQAQVSREQLQLRMPAPCPRGAAVPSLFLLKTASLAAFTSPVGKSGANIYPAKYLKNAGGQVFVEDFVNLGKRVIVTLIN